MNTPPTEPAPEAIAVARATRFAFAAIVLGLSYPNIRFALNLHTLGGVYTDMLGGDSEIGAVTSFVLRAQPFLVALSILIPIAALVGIFRGRLSRSIYISGVSIIVVFVQLFFTWHAGLAPFYEIMRRMQGGAPQ